MRRVKSAPARLGDLHLRPAAKVSEGPTFACPVATETDDASGTENRSTRPDVARMAMVEASSMVKSNLATSGWPTDLCDFVAVLMEEVLCGGDDACSVAREALVIALGRAATNALASIVVHKVMLSLVAHVSAQ